MSARVHITCDGCGTGFSWPQHVGAVSLGAFRRNLAETEGWHTVRVPWKQWTTLRDICATCWGEGIR